VSCVLNNDNHITSKIHLPT